MSNPQSGGRLSSNFSSLAWLITFCRKDFCRAEAEGIDVGLHGVAFGVEMAR